MQKRICPLMVTEIYNTLKARISMGVGFSLLFILWGIPLILLAVDIQPYDFLTKGLGLNLDHIKE